jgi:hypothetical protein
MEKNQLAAWFLLAALVSSENQQTTLTKIREAGDYLNHAVFSDQEIVWSLAYLEEKNLLVRNGNMIVLQPAALELQKKASKKNKNILKVMGNLGDLLI